jgi:hypothetical protein
MTREEIIHNMQAIEQALEQRVEVWRVIVEMDGTISQRIYRGSFSVSPRASRNGDAKRPPASSTARSSPSVSLSEDSWVPRRNSAMRWAAT